MTTATAREASRLPFSDETAAPLGCIIFTVNGLPATAGSKRAFPFKRPDGSLGVNVSPDNKKAKPWMAAVAAEAREAYEGELLRGPIELTVVFRLPRPQGHFGTGRNAGLVRDSAPRHPQVKPDLLKMARAIEDALTGVIWKDDAQIVQEHLVKYYGEPACCSIRIRPLE